MFIPLFAGIDSQSEVAKLMLTLFAGFAITGMSYLWPLRKLRPPRVRRSSFWYAFALVAGGLAVWVILAFRGNFFIVAFSDIYDVRTGADALIEGTWLNYPLMLLPGAINPFLMGWGLFHKKTWIFLAGAAGQLLIYSTLATKGSATSILFIPAIYLILRGDRRQFAMKLTCSFIALFVVLSLSFVVAGDQSSPLLATLLFVVFSRTFGANGLLTAQYYDFFQINPHTYFSHAKLFNLFFTYPYRETIGIEVGSHYTGDPTFDATAHFWASDGLAGLGLPGVLLVSVICALIFWMLDSIAERHDIRFSTLAIGYVAYNFANGSLFTTLLSGGLALLMILLYFMPQENPEPSFQPMISQSVVPAG
jgi:hypothetical protein